MIPIGRFRLNSMPLSSKSSMTSASTILAWRSSRNVLISGNMIRTSPSALGTKDGAQLGTEHVCVSQRKSNAAQTQERIAFRPPTPARAAICPRPNPRCESPRAGHRPPGRLPNRPQTGFLPSVRNRCPGKEIRFDKAQLRRRHTV